MAKRPPRWLGQGLSYAEIDDLPGRMIVLEGTDGVGRSAQIEMLSAWIESQGFGVVSTGWTRSRLMGPTIERAKSGHTLDARTFSLLYAADFADRLELQILPALRAGFVVVADRYVYTAFARDAVRGADPRWVRELFGFALEPDLVIYLDVDIDVLMPRILNGKGCTYWESGMDLKLADNIYDSCVAYQTQILEEFGKMSKEYGFDVVNASGPRENTQRAIRRRVQKVLDEIAAARGA
ncbi:MAG: dTMP kinase [Armatimonadia bacterium]|nr:dTMP kinase [Armatimonadia bacterium]